MAGRTQEHKSTTGKLLSSFPKETCNPHQPTANPPKPTSTKATAMNTMPIMNAPAITLLLREPLRVKVVKLFYKKFAVELVAFAAGAADFTLSAVTMLSVKRGATFGGDVSIPFDASIQPTRLVRSSKDAVFGLENKTIRIRAPSVQTYEEWTSAISLALKSAAATANKTSSRIATVFIIDNSISLKDDSKRIGIGNKSTNSSNISSSCASSADTASSETSDYSGESSSSSSGYSTDYAIRDSTAADCITPTPTRRALALVSSPSHSCSSSLLDEVELLLNTVGELNQWTSCARLHRLGLQARTEEAVQVEASKHDTCIYSRWV